MRPYVCCSGGYGLGGGNGCSSGELGVAVNEVDCADTGGVPLRDLLRCGCNGTTDGVDGLAAVLDRIALFRFGIEDDVVCGLKKVEMACNKDILQLS